MLLPLLAAVASSSGHAQWWLSARGWGVLGGTLGFAGLAGLVALGVGWALARAGVAWVAVAAVPLVLPASLVGTAWIAALGRTGPLGDWLTAFDPPVAAAIVGLRHAGLAGLVLLLGSPPPDAAAAVYRPRGGWFWLGVLPRWRVWLAAWAVAALVAAAEPILPGMLLVHTYATRVTVQANALLDPGGAVAVALPMVAVGALAAWLVPRGLPLDADAQRPASGCARPSRGKLLGTAALLLTAGVPLVALAARTGDPASVAAAWSAARGDAAFTLGLALTAGPLAAALGWVLGAAWHAGSSLAPWAAVLLVTPATVLGLGWLELLGVWPLSLARDGSLPLVLATACRFAPAAAVAVLLARRLRAEAPLDAARLMVPGRWRRLRWVGWPAARAAVLGAGALSVALATTELDLAVLLAPSGRGTLGVRLYGLIHTAPDAEVAAAALASLALLLPLAAVPAAVWLFARRGRHA